MKVAIQGELGSFSHEAAEKMLRGATLVPCVSSAEVFKKVKSGAVAAAVIPIENSLAGSVAEHFDLMLSAGFFVRREFRLRIQHNLIAAPGVRLKDLRQVFSHPVALDQCRQFFREHTNIQATPFYDTAGAVKHVVSKGLKEVGAIASLQAASQYGAHVLLKGIEDNKQNFTRFFLISPRRKVLSDADKTSLVFAVRNVPGALFKALSVFALRDIDLSKIESRPVPGRPWEYVFYVDILRGEDEASKNALRHLGEICEFVRVLGIYPRAR